MDAAKIKVAIVLIISVTLLVIILRKAYRSRASSNELTTRSRKGYQGSYRKKTTPVSRGQQVAARVKRMEERLAGILTIGFLLFFVIIISLVTYKISDPDWAIFGLAQRIGLKLSLLLLGISLVVIITVFIIAYRQSAKIGLNDESVVERGLILVALIAFVMLIALFLSLATGRGDRDWVISGLTERLGRDRSVYCALASAGSLLLCLGIYTGYNYITRIIRNNLKKKNS